MITDADRGGLGQSRGRSRGSGERGAAGHGGGGEVLSAHGEPMVMTDGDDAAG